MQHSRGIAQGALDACARLRRRAAPDRHGVRHRAREFGALREFLANCVHTTLFQVGALLDDLDAAMTLRGSLIRRCAQTPAGARGVVVSDDITQRISAAARPLAKRVWRRACVYIKRAAPRRSPPQPHAATAPPPPLAGAAPSDDRPAAAARVAH
ncbi:hypothetical protein AAFM48_12460 [Burkholderia pseudomallei]